MGAELMSYGVLKIKATRKPELVIGDVDLLLAKAEAAKQHDAYKGLKREDPAFVSGVAYLVFRSVDVSTILDGGFCSHRFRSVFQAGSY